MKIIGSDRRTDWTWGKLEEGRVARIDGGYHNNKLVLKISTERGFILKEKYEDEDTIIVLFGPDVEISAAFDAELRLG